MPIISVPQSATLSLRVQTGIGANGAPVYKNINFSNVKTTAADEFLYAVALGLSTLQNHTLNAINRSATTNLVEQ